MQWQEREGEVSAAFHRGENLLAIEMADEESDHEIRSTDSEWLSADDDTFPPFEVLSVDAGEPELHNSKMAAAVIPASLGFGMPEDTSNNTTYVYDGLLADVVAGAKDDRIEHALLRVDCSGVAMKETKASHVTSISDQHETKQPPRSNNAVTASRVILHLAAAFLGFGVKIWCMKQPQV